MRANDGRALLEQAEQQETGQYQAASLILAQPFAGFRIDVVGQTASRARNGDERGNGIFFRHVISDPPLNGHSLDRAAKQDGRCWPISANRPPQIRPAHPLGKPLPSLANRLKLINIKTGLP